MVYEYSRFPFVLPCKNVVASSVIGCLHVCQLFSVYGMPTFIHSDRGSSFMSKELCHFLLNKGIATSLTTPYNPACNGKVERYNGAVWKAIIMPLKTGNLPVTYWQDVLPDALYSLPVVFVIHNHQLQLVVVHNRNCRKYFIREVFEIWETIIHWRIYANLAIDTRPHSLQTPCLS